MLKSVSRKEQAAGPPAGWRLVALHCLAPASCVPPVARAPAPAPGGCARLAPSVTLAAPPPTTRADLQAVSRLRLYTPFLATVIVVLIVGSMISTNVAVVAQSGAAGGLPRLRGMAPRARRCFSGAGGI